MIEFKDYVTIAREVEPGECLYCLYGEIPVNAEAPFNICLKHIDITLFILEKAGLHPRIEFR